MQTIVTDLSTAPFRPALCLQTNRNWDPVVTAKGRQIMMKTQQHSEQQPRRLPIPEAQSVDKGRKHEAFESGSYGSDRRSLARAIRFDRKR